MKAVCFSSRPPRHDPKNRRSRDSRARERSLPISRRFLRRSSSSSTGSSVEGMNFQTFTSIGTHDRETRYTHRTYILRTSTRLVISVPSRIHQLPRREVYDWSEGNHRIYWSHLLFEARSSQCRPMLADRSRMDVPVCKLLSRRLDGVSLAYIDTYMNSVVVMNHFHDYISI